MTCHEYDGGSMWISLRVYVNIMAVNCHEFSVVFDSGFHLDTPKQIQVVLEIRFYSTISTYSPLELWISTTFH